MRGESLGRRIGFPTANINPHHEVIPPVGIYAVKIIFSGEKYDGICYIGTKPTFLNSKHKIQNSKPKVIEVHIFDFHKDIYGEFLEIQFVKLIRPDKKFASIADLTKQIQKDIISCRKIIKVSS